MGAKRLSSLERLCQSNAGVDGFTPVLHAEEERREPTTPYRYPGLSLCAVWSLHF
jgi:hypothetical protein